MRWLFLVFMIDFVCSAGCARVACARQFSFGDLDNYPTSGAADRQHEQLIQYGQKYVLAHFPIGSSVDSAITNLTNLGASCEPGLDAEGSGEYVCYHREPAAGAAYFFETIVWSIVIKADEKSRHIESVSVDTWEDGL
jgi:hypothetical protein